MKKIFGIIVLGLLLGSNANAGKEGYGEITLSPHVVNGYFKYLGLKSIHNKSLGAQQYGIGQFFAVSSSGDNYGYSYCPRGQNCRASPLTALQGCRKRTSEKCYIFSKKRRIVWNKVNVGIKRSSTESEIRAKLIELGFLGGINAKKIEKEKKVKVEKKKEPKKNELKKVVKKYELKGERSIALSWEGYEDLIAGTVKFDEADYKGTLNLPLPNNDGTCDGTYSLQKGGKGTWQIACSNNMGAAGTLKWVKDGGITGSGRDHNDKKVKFTVSKKS